MAEQRSEFDELARVLRDFAEARDWGKFHNPKNLAMALAGEAGELLAEFQWLTPEESSAAALSSEKREAIAMEIADIQIYMIRLADVLRVNIPDAVRRKVDVNEQRF
jgi:dCTP diphosphatase